MATNALEKRKYDRVSTSSYAISDGIAPGCPLIVNLGRGGACLWLSDPPPREQGLALSFRLNGQEPVLRSRIVWARLRLATSDRENPIRTDGWLAGFAFTDGDGDVLLPDIPHDILRERAIAARVLVEDNAADNWQKERESSGTPGLITFSEQSVFGVKAAAKELLPVFARHFTDIHIVFTRDRLEISAPFRSPAELTPLATRQGDYRTIQASQVAHPAAPIGIEQPAALVPPKSTGVMGGRRRGLIAVVALAAITVAGAFMGVSHKPEDRATPKVPAEGLTIPGWASGLDQTSLNDWIEVQKKFDLPDALVHSTIQILRADNKYTPGQLLYDLTRYPAQVKRAFSLLASQQAGTPFDFGPLEKELKGRIVAGVRFPDEPPGGVYSSLQRESFNNVVVLATIELLHRRQGDSSVKEILAALQRGRT